MQWMGPFRRWSMRNPELPAPGWGGCWDDRPGSCCPAPGDQPAGGLHGGTVVWDSPPPGQAYTAPGHALRGRGLAGVAVSGVFCLSGGLEGRVSAGTAGGLRRLGSDRWQMAAACFSGDMEHFGSRSGNFPVAFEKIFVFSENFVCICEKMGYNKMELSSANAAEIRR